jgi:hypothetical protein
VRADVERRGVLVAHGGGRVVVVPGPI